MFTVCYIVKWVKLKLKKSKFLNIYTLCSYVLQLNKLKHLLFMTFLKSRDSLTHLVFTFFFFLRNSPQLARASSFTRFLDHTQ